MNILHIIPHFGAKAGGTATAVRLLATNQMMRGADVTILTLSTGGKTWTDLDKIQIVEQPGHLNYGYSVQMAKWLEKNAKKFDVGIIHGLWQYPGWIAARTLKKANIPYIVYPHGMSDIYFKQHHPFKHLKKAVYWNLIEHSILENADTVIYTAEEEKRRATFISTTRAGIIPLGIPAPPSEKEAPIDLALEQWPQLKEKKIVLFFGRLHPKKGVDVLLKAFAEILKNKKEWLLVFAGPNAQKTQELLYSLAKKCDIENKVVFTGLLEGNFKWSILRLANVFVLPSHQENFGFAVVEALAVGCPVIISNQVNIWKEIADQKAGIVCAPTLEELSLALKHWNSFNDEEISSFKKRALTCTQFNLSSNSEKLWNLLQEITASSEPALK